MSELSRNSDEGLCSPALRWLVAESLKDWPDPWNELGVELVEHDIRSAEDTSASPPAVDSPPPVPPTQA